MIENKKMEYKKIRSLKVAKPQLIEEWDYEKNGELTPKDVTPGTKKRVWWICEKNHSWKAAVGSRTNGARCPYCVGRKAIRGETDLATLNPELAKKWNYEKNGTLSPEEVTEKSAKKVWWICGKGHSWEATIGNCSKGKGCPYCAGRKAIRGETDLATTNPKLAKEWKFETKR